MTRSTSTTSKLPLESSRTRSLLRYLNSVGGFFFKIHGSPFQPRLVDIIGCLRSRFYALEVKRPGNKPTRHQQMTLDRFKKSGAVVGVVWEKADCEKILKKSLTSLSGLAYLEPTKRDGHRADKRERAIKMSPARKNRAGKSGTAVASKKPVVEEIEDLEDLDDFEDELEDELEDGELDEDDLMDDEDEEEEEEVAVPSKKARNDAKATAAKSARKPSAVKVVKPAAKVAAKSATKAAPAAKAKSNGNAANLAPRRLPEGMVGASEIASQLGMDAKTVRTILRKENIAKSDSGTYAWKPNSRDFQAVVKKVKAATAA